MTIWDIGAQKYILCPYLYNSDSGCAALVTHQEKNNTLQVILKVGMIKINLTLLLSFCTNRKICHSWVLGQHLDSNWLLLSKASQNAISFNAIHCSLVTSFYIFNATVSI